MFSTFFFIKMFSTLPYTMNIVLLITFKDIQKRHENATKASFYLITNCDYRYVSISHRFFFCLLFESSYTVLLVFHQLFFQLTIKLSKHLNHNQTKLDNSMKNFSLCVTLQVATLPTTILSEQKQSHHTREACGKTADRETRYPPAPSPFLHDHSQQPTGAVHNHRFNQTAASFLRPSWSSHHPSSGPSLP